MAVPALRTLDKYLTTYICSHLFLSVSSAFQYRGKTGTRQVPRVLVQLVRDGSVRAAVLAFSMYVCSRARIEQRFVTVTVLVLDSLLNLRM